MIKVTTLFLAILLWQWVTMGNPQKMPKGAQGALKHPDPDLSYITDSSAQPSSAHNPKDPPKDPLAFKQFPPLRALKLG